ncbi:MAG TPA: A24 family peptidase [Pyrinomonadaceae bacterium]|nr:A24 family peptidase [Pyrinomonadaceae bacterium]
MHLQSGILLLVTAACAITDARWGKVYNVVTYPAALAGIGLSFYFAPPAPLMSILGLAAGLVFFGLLRKISGMGAGDVKLMAAVGALNGFPFLVYSTFYILCAASVTALLLVAWQGRLVPVLKWVAFTLASVVSPKYSAPNRDHELTSMPFAPAIFIGSAFSIYLETIHGYFSF